MSFSEVSKANVEDIDGIKLLLDYYAGMGELLPRPKREVAKTLDTFKVIRKGDQVVACGSLEHFTPELAEIRSLMVEPKIVGGGLGKLIALDLIQTAKERQVGRVMALTYVPEFFHKLGFKTVNKSSFPEKIWGICVNCYKFHNCDEIAVLLTLSGSESQNAHS